MKSIKRRHKLSTYKCAIFYVPKRTDTVRDKYLTTTFKGRNDISHDEVRKFYYFQDNDPVKTEFDVTLIIGYEIGCTVGSVLLMRFNPSCNLVIPKFSNTHEKVEFEQRLFSNLLPKLNGIERKRTGGSSGQFRYSKELMTLLHTTNLTPRNSKGVVWLRAKNDLGIHAFWIETKSLSLRPSVRHCFYSTPRRGGSFYMDDAILNDRRYQFLLDFVLVKPLGAIIIDAIHQKLARKKCLSNNNANKTSNCGLPT